MQHKHKTGHPEDQSGANLRLVAWEITRNCNLSCIHCRASATQGPYTGELDTEKAFRLIDQIADVKTEVEKCYDRCGAVDEAGHFVAAQELGQRLEHTHAGKLDGHASDRQRQETDNHE